MFQWTSGGIVPPVLLWSGFDPWTLCLGGVSLLVVVELKKIKNEKKSIDLTENLRNVIFYWCNRKENIRAD